MYIYTREYEFEDTLVVTFNRRISPASVYFIFKLISLFKLLILRYMTTPPALRLDDDTATDDVVAIYLFLAVLQYDLRSKLGTFTDMEFFISYFSFAV